MGRKIAVGCAVIVGLFAIVSVTSMVVLQRYVRNNMPDTERLEALQAEMDERFGEPEDFVPPLAGLPTPQRAEEFVAARSELHRLSRPIVAGMGSFADRMEEQTSSALGKLKFAVTSVGPGMELFREGIGFIAVADSILLARDMGRGEYLHWSLLATQGWLGFEPAAVETGEGDRARAMGQMAGELQEGARRVLMAQVANRRDALRELEDPTPAEQRWLAEVEAELERCREDSSRLPFVDPLPAGFGALFAPWRAELQATVPRSGPELFLEAALLGEVETGGGVRINISTD